MYLLPGRKRQEEGCVVIIKKSVLVCICADSSGESSWAEDGEDCAVWFGPSRRADAADGEGGSACWCDGELRVGGWRGITRQLTGALTSVWRLPLLMCWFESPEGGREGGGGRSD